MIWFRIIVGVLIFLSIFHIVYCFKWDKKKAAKEGPWWSVSGGDPFTNFILGTVKTFPFKFQKIFRIIFSIIIFFGLLAILISNILYG